MQIQLSQLKSGSFKAPVTLKFATEEADKNGNTRFSEMRFIGHFQRVSDERRKAFKDALAACESRLSEADPEVLQEEINEITRAFVSDYFVGFEAHPGQPFPFLDEHNKPLESCESVIREMLKYQDIQSAVAKAFYAVKQVNMQGMLAGNSGK